MAINFLDKVNASTSPLPDINKVSDADMNQIKNEHNALELQLANLQGQLNNLKDISGLVPFVFNFDDDTSASSPSVGGFKFNTATPASATELYISAQDDNFLVDEFLDKLQIDSLIYIKSRDAVNIGGVFKVTSYTKNGSTWYTLGVNALDGSGAIPNGTVCALYILPPSGAGAGEANTASTPQLTRDALITMPKVGVDLQFKALRARGMNISNATDYLEFSVYTAYFTGLTSIGGTINTSPLTWDWDVFTARYHTLVTNVVWQDVNLPSFGTKVIEFILTGNYTLTLPAYWEAMPNNDTYDGSKRNHFIVSCLSGASGNEVVLYSLKNLST